MPGRDPNHWLHRFDAGEWLLAAENELARAEDALLHKQQRTGVAGARRAAGMAWNALLVGLDDAAAEKYGRSYMEHLQAIARDETADEALVTAARALLSAPLATNVIPLGKGDTRLAAMARVIVDAAKTKISAS
jgi:hypothetical protein